MNQTIVLAGGCFWCIEEIFKELNGVESVISGYANGQKENPTYEQVSMGNTGYAESIEIKFDDDVISLSDILKIFFTSHDPTTLNRQGHDEGTQYRSGIFYSNDNQKAAAIETIKEIESENLYKDPVVTEVIPLTHFYPAEDYHQNYYKNNPDQMYCRIVIDPKITKFRKLYFDKLKK